MNISATIMKIIIYFLVFYLIYRLLIALPHLIRPLLKRVLKKGNEFPQEEAHDMVPCFRCQTYVSEGLALSDSGQLFCGEKCRNESSTTVSQAL